MSEASKQAKTEPHGRAGNAGSTADTTTTIERLARRLSSASGAEDGIAADLQQLREQIASLEGSFLRQLAEARARASAAEAKLADQKDRLNALGRGREETMLALGEARTELARLKRERDELHRRLSSVENMQTATMTLTEDEAEEPQAVIHSLPSVEELMASLHSLAAAAEAQPEELRREPEEASSDSEMIPAELVFPEGVEEEPEEPAPTARSRKRNSKVLVFVDADPPIKYPLFNEITTIGRSETADIRVDGDYISRVHARIVLTAEGAVVEDLASTNGIKVNFRPVDRRQLRHGDILSLGKLHFTFIDTETSGAD